MTETNDAPIAELEAPVVEHISQRKRLWRTFRKNRTALVGLVLVVLLVLMALLAPLLAPHDPIEQDAFNRLAGPSLSNPFGRDGFGRDVLSRVIFGARISLVVGVATVAIGGTIGTLLGMVAGFTGGRTENLIMRTVDVIMAFPSLLMGLLVLAVLGAGVTKMIIAIGIILSPAFVRLAHSATLSAKEYEFVLAAQADGASRSRILFAQIFPNILGEIIVLASIWMANAIRIEASLSFLGLGVSPPTAAWGTMIRDGFQFLSTARWIAIYPGVAVVVAVLAFNLLGDGLRDVLDPKSYE